MKRYMLFAGENYYPDGGMRDFIKSVATIQEANEWCDEIKAGNNYFDWWQVVDSIEDMLVFYNLGNKGEIREWQEKVEDK
jgi:3-methyladenine DNA glycosylase AlkD